MTISSPIKIGSLLPGLNMRVFVLALFMLAGLVVLTSKLWHEQVVEQTKWYDRVKTGSSVTVRIPSVRGEIRDRNGITLVANRSSYAVDFYLPQMVKGYRESFAELVKQDEELVKRDPSKKHIFPIASYRTTIDGMPDDVRVPDIVQIVNETVIPTFKDLNIASDPNVRKLDYNADQLERHFRTNEQVPYRYLEDVSFNTIAKLSENDSDLPGVEVALRPVRQYIYGSLAAHVLGYVGSPQDINKEADIADFTYYQPDVVGQSSVERAFDKYLRGKPGVRKLERTAKGKVGAEIERIAPTPGAHVYLTIDARIQMIVERTLREAGVGRAAAVVVDPNNGDILAMASVPNYDPNVFIPKISAEDMKHFDDDGADPLLNRCIGGYAPGSTFKTITALAGLHAGISPYRTFNCAGGVTYGNKLMKCWIFGKGVHGSLDMLGGIKNSCNCYFFQLANSIGGEKKTALAEIETIGDVMGLGMKSDLPLSGERSGILPGPRYLTAKGMSAMLNSSGNIANTSIGQGMVEATPVQMAMICATLANGGTSYFPRLVSRLVDSNGDDIRESDGSLALPLEPKVRATLQGIGITRDQVEIVRRGMWKVVNEPGGTGKAAAIKGVEVAGKTGTAQFWRVEKDKLKEKDNRVWFMCFAPYKQPKYAICVMVEGAKSGGGVAAPIVQKMLKEALGLEAGYDTQPKWLPPVAGSFEQIEKIAFKEDGGLTKLVANAYKGTDQKPGTNRIAEDGEIAGDHDGDIHEESRSKRDGPSPEVRNEADARGKVNNSQNNNNKPNLWQRIFGSRNKTNTQPAPQGR